MSYTERMENKEEYKFILGENSITKSLSAEEVLKLELDPDVHVKLIRKYEISFLSQIPFEIAFIIHCLRALIRTDLVKNKQNFKRS